MTSKIWAIPVYIGDQYYLRMTTGDSVLWLGNVEKNRPVRLDPKQPRNAKHHRLYWAIMSKVAHQTDKYEKGEDLHEAILFQLGMCTKRVVIQPNGSWEVTWDRDSTSFDKMGQAGFNEFFDKAMGMIENDMGFNVQQIIAEIKGEFG